VAEATSVLIRPGRADEGARLKEIAVASKGHWGYEQERVQQWADHGDFSPKRLTELIVFVAELGGRSVGWSSLIPHGETAWLEDLWVEPGWIGQGIGGSLFGHTAAHARTLGAKRLEWEAEPNAIGFYEKMGATHIRESQSAWGRTLSVMAVELDG
jgi:GNAT superfamily N-acetyltransferase